MFHKNNAHFAQLQLQLHKIQALPPPEKYSDQQQRKKEKQHLEFEIANYEAYLKLAIGQQITDGAKLGTIVSLLESPGGKPEAWVSWYGETAVPEQPCRLKPEPELSASLKVGDTVTIFFDNQTDDITIASFLGDGWILATNDRRYHAESIASCPECQHRWTICWTPGSRLVKMCQSCLAKEEVTERSILQEWLDLIENLKQELVDKAAAEPSKAKQLETGIKDKDKQLYWLKAKLASLRDVEQVEPEEISTSSESIEVEVVEAESPDSPPLESIEQSEGWETVTETKPAIVVAGEIMDLARLSLEELEERKRLEKIVTSSFAEAAIALKQLQEKKLYRNTHSTFDSYCRETFGMQRAHSYRLIDAANVLANLEANCLPLGDKHTVECYEQDLSPSSSRNKMSPNVLEQNLSPNSSRNKISPNILEQDLSPIGRQLLPTNERQVRPLVSLSPTEQVEVWQQAVVEAGNKIPSGRLVQDVVQRIKTRNPMPNPFTVGDVCLLSSKGNPELRTRHNFWCIISEVLEFSCIVQTWTGQVQVKVENLKSLDYSTEDKEKMRKLCARLNRIDVGALEETAWVLLFQIAKLQRASLTELEEKLLSAIEDIKID